MGTETGYGLTTHVALSLLEFCSVVVDNLYTICVRLLCLPTSLEEGGGFTSKPGKVGLVFFAHGPRGAHPFWASDGN